MDPLEPVRKVMGAVDRWQRRTRWASVPYAVVKKFGDDNANLVVVALAWYGFTAIFPLLLVVVTVLGSIGAQSLGTGIVKTLQEFPVIGTNFSPSSGSSTLHGSTLGLIIGLLGLVYGAQGVTQTAQQAMATVWNIPQTERAGFLPRLGRSLAGLISIGLAFLINAFVTTYATGGTHNYAVRIPVLAGLLVINAGLYFATFTLLTAKAIGPRGHLPGAIAGAVAFTALITVGTGLVTHQLKHADATYGAFGTVIGIVAFLLLLAKLSMYAAELNPVLSRRLYPRALPLGGEPTDADREVLAALVHAEQRRDDEAIGVGFGDNAAHEAAADAAESAGQGQSRSAGKPGDTVGALRLGPAPRSWTGLEEGQGQPRPGPTAGSGTHMLAGVSGGVSGSRTRSAEIGVTPDPAAAAVRAAPSPSAIESA